MGTKQTQKRVKAGTSKDGVETRKIKFVEAYIANGNNATQAAKTAGYSEKSAHVYGCNLLKDSKVAQMLKERQSELAAKHQLTTDIVLAELSKIVRADLRNLFDESGALKSPNEWGDEVAGSVASLEVVEEFDGKGEDRQSIGFTKKVKLWDKNSAIEKAMKHLGMFQRDNEQIKPDVLDEMSQLELARRVAFILRSGAQAKGV